MGIKMAQDTADMRPTKFKAPAYEYRIEPVETYYKKTDEYRISKGYTLREAEEGKKLAYAVRRTDRDPSITSNWALLYDHNYPDLELRFHDTKLDRATYETISFYPEEKRMTVSRLSEISAWAQDYVTGDVAIDFTVCSVHYD